MSAHELARALLKVEDLPVVFDDEVQTREVTRVGDPTKSSFTGERAGPTNALGFESARWCLHLIHEKV